jgi:hypothetical protein
METKLRLSSLSAMAFELTSAIDHGFIDEFSFDEIYKEIESGRLIAFLKERLGDAVDLSILEKNPEQNASFIELMQRTSNVLSGQERRKLGIEKHGLCLLLAFCIEAMQHPYNWDWEWEAEKMGRLE